MTPQTVIQVKAVLSADPQQGHEVARRAGVRFEDAYQALVRLYDAGEAFICRAPYTNRMEGWTS